MTVVLSISFGILALSLSALIGVCWAKDILVNWNDRRLAPLSALLLIFIFVSSTVSMFLMYKSGVGKIPGTGYLLRISKFLSEGGVYENLSSTVIEDKQILLVLEKKSGIVIPIVVPAKTLVPKKFVFTPEEADNFTAVLSGKDE